MKKRIFLFIIIVISNHHLLGQENCDLPRITMTTVSRGFVPDTFKIGDMNFYGKVDSINQKSTALLDMGDSKIKLVRKGKGLNGYMIFSETNSIMCIFTDSIGLVKKIINQAPCYYRVIEFDQNMIISSLFQCIYDRVDSCSLKIMENGILRREIIMNPIEYQQQKQQLGNKYDKYKALPVLSKEYDLEGNFMFETLH